MKAKIAFPGIGGNLVVRICGSGDDMSVLIYGDPQGLRTFSKLLVAVAALNQKDIPDQNLPVGVGHHLHLKPVEQLNRESLPLIVGRLDGKGTREFTNIEPLVKRRNKKPKRIVENLNR